jgi:Leucine-rich repeat (LRR) protein
MGNIKTLPEIGKELNEKGEMYRINDEMRNAMEMVDYYIRNIREDEVTNITEKLNDKISQISELDKKIKELTIERNKISKEIEKSVDTSETMNLFKMEYTDVETNKTKTIYIKSRFGFFDDQLYILNYNRFYSNLKNTNNMDYHNSRVYKFKVKDVTLEKIS